jgi:hypothetical protein
MSSTYAALDRPTRHVHVQSVVWSLIASVGMLPASCIPGGGGLNTWQYLAKQKCPRSKGLPSTTRTSRLVSPVPLLMCY